MLMHSQIVKRILSLKPTVNNQNNRRSKSAYTFVSINNVIIYYITGPFSPRLIKLPIWAKSVTFLRIFGSFLLQA